MNPADINAVLDKDGYVVDAEKNLYARRDNKCVFIQQLKKRIYDLAAYGGSTYFLDSFGDCYAICGGGIRFIFGILGMPTFFAVRNDRFFVQDAYQRLWAYTLDGRLDGLVFLKARILSIEADEKCVALLLERPKNGDTEFQNIKIYGNDYQLAREGQADAIPEDLTAFCAK